MTRSITTANERQVVVAAPIAHRDGVSRRNILKSAFWLSIATAFAGGAAALVNSIYPRGVGGFGGPITVPALLVPRPGDAPRQNVNGRFLLVNLAPGEGAPPGADAAHTGGIVAFWTKCPHLGCTIPWRGDVTYKGQRGVFQCPCHGSTYTKAGVRVFGPAPRSMDTMSVQLTDNGDVVVQTGIRTDGGDDNPARAIPWMPPGGGEAAS
jgi:cytochrome b6-f complex iron-sulfur subunit